MARPANENSVRQRAFKLLNGMQNVKREVALKVLKDTFTIGDSYAATLHASFRTINKQNGVMVQVFSVRDMRDGKATTPYIKVQNVFNPTPTMCLNPTQAKKAYEMNMKQKIAASKVL